jgi:hypothetical protein
MKWGCVFHVTKVDLHFLEILGSTRNLLKLTEVSCGFLLVSIINSQNKGKR